MDNRVSCGSRAVSQLRFASKTDSAAVLAKRMELYGRPIYANEFRRRLKDARRIYFFLGWCAGVLTIVLALWLAPYVDACDELPPPDETIKQIRAEAI